MARSAGTHSAAANRWFTATDVVDKPCFDEGAGFAGTCDRLSHLLTVGEDIQCLSIHQGCSEFAACFHRGVDHCRRRCHGIADPYPSRADCEGQFVPQLMVNVVLTNAIQRREELCSNGLFDWLE